MSENLIQLMSITQLEQLANDTGHPIDQYRRDFETLFGSGNKQTGQDGYRLDVTRLAAHGHYRSMVTFWAWFVYLHDRINKTTDHG